MLEETLHCYECLLTTCLAEQNSIFDKHGSPEQGGRVAVIFDVAFKGMEYIYHNIIVASMISL